MGLSRASLGLKLNLALVFFFLMLGGLTLVLILYGFNRTQDNAKTRSQEGLEELGELALLGVIAGQADYGGLALEAAADMGFRAAEYLEHFERSGAVTNFDTSRLTKTDQGVIYDPDPNRITDVAAPNYVELNDEVLEEIVYSARLDAIVPVLMQNFPDSIREENFDPIAFAFIGTKSTVRYFPPVGIWEDVPPDLDVTTVEQRLGEAANPERKMFWRAPYEDAAGKGLVMTVEVPVYDGDTYKGAFQIDLSLEKLVAQIELLKLTSVGFAFYVDSRGDVIQSEAKDIIDAELEAGNTDLQATLDTMRAGGEGVDRVMVGGSEMFIGYSPVDGIGGNLGLAASVDEITASAAAITAGIEDEGRRTLQVTLLGMGALFGLGLIGATYLNRRILIRPIEALVTGTRAVAQGDFGTRIAVRGNDELATLGHSFNQMTADIQREVQQREAAQSELAALFASMTDAVVVLSKEGRYIRVPSTNAPRLLMPPEDLPGRLMTDVMPPGQAEEFMSIIRQALDEQRTATVEYPLELEGSTYWYSAAVSPISNQEVVVVARDITDRVNARQELEHQVEERTRELTTLLRISSDVASTLDLGPLLSVVLEQVQEIADYERCSILTLEGDQFVLLDSRTTVGLGPLSVSLPVDRGGPILSHIFRHQPVIIDDVTGDSATAIAYRESIGELRDTVFKGVRAWMGVPLALKDRIIGILTLSHTQPGFYTERHAGLVSAIATQIAVAIENARLYEQAQQLAAVEERQRLARELHDSVSQALYGIALGARTARTLLDNEPARAVEPVEYVLSLAEAGLAEMRALIFELRPESLETEGLVEALQKQTAATRARYGLDVRTELGEEPLLSLSEKEVFYRVAQEALHNVVKHAHASQVELKLMSEDGAVTLEVRDNGDGFDTATSFPGHMGLVSMRERATSLGASLNVESTPGAGTTVRLSLTSR